MTIIPTPEEGMGNHPLLTSGVIDRPNYREINAAALASLPAVLNRILPGGRRSASEYVVLNPLRNDQTAGSFKVRLSGSRAGAWSDFATGDKGGDVISLIAYLDSVSQS